MNPSAPLLLCLLFSQHAFSQDSAVSESPSASTTENQAGRLPAAILEKKREGSYFTGVPAIAFSPDSGFIYGAVIFNFDNGSKEDPRFAYTPYLRKVSVLAIQSTKGLNQLKIDLDFPKFMNSNHRLKPAFYFTNNISEQYFGVTESSMSSLKYPDEIGIQIGKDTTSDYGQYEEELQKQRSDGRTWFRYNQYVHKESEFALNDEINFWTPWTFLKVGVSAARVDVRDYSGKSVDAVDSEDRKKNVKATMAPTLLATDEAAGAIIGYDGGTVNSLEFGFSADTRDFEPDPSSGFYTSLTAQTARKELGSSFDFARYTGNLRGFYSPMAALTLGTQFQYVWAEGEVPFWELPAIGGRNSLKGHRINRFKSTASSQSNTEIRWRAVTLGGEGQNFVLTPLIYVDYARVYDEPFIIKHDGWRRSSGLGMRIVWNQATVIGIEKPLQGEEKSLYVNINHIF